MDKKSIDKLVKRYIFEIMIATFFIVVSYYGIKSKNFSESALIAKNSSDYPIQYIYGRNTSDILAYENLLDRGELTLRNPNKNAKTAKVELEIYGDLSSVTDLKIVFDEKTIDASILYKENDKSILSLGSIDLKGFDNHKSTLSIYGDPFKDTVFSYNVKITEEYDI